MLTSRIKNKFSRKKYIFSSIPSSSLQENCYLFARIKSFKKKKKIFSIRLSKIIIYLSAKIESFSQGKINILNDKFPFSLQEKLIKNKIRREKYFFNSFRAKSLIFVIMLFTRIGLNPPSEKKKSSIIIFPPVKEYERSLKKNFVNWR